ncbi:nucleotidyltransferase family protein [Desulfobacula phenolica]|uniref:CBS domain-containing protein n=1 Tax=Desulfobacula phenolica TaxID=90732 RepID=A0A1H2DRW3_9BACT|nr:nucleotidyltransferase family protein [Desulfobacula phenolica]SDT85643.1 CBS domain-containing protein [Desulfobacula phenolica]
MKDWKKTSVGPGTSIKETIAVIDKSALQIALVVDPDDKLLGTVTDGDIRRGILKGISLDEPVERIYYVSPLTASVKDDPGTMHRIMKEQLINQLPIVDHKGRVVELMFLRDILKEKKQKNPVVLMAGGLGTRLRPLTESCPKPLLKIGGTPLLETILEGFIKKGFDTFYISVNYKADMIEDYFGDGSKWGVNIEYLRETQRLGTAGSIKLLSEKPLLPFIVMNGDLLTKVDFKQLLEFHINNNKLSNAMATMCVREYNMQVPYGVIKQEGNKLVQLDEKPVQRFFVNGGIYVFQPDMMDLIPDDQYFDMTHLFDKMMEKDYKTVVFQIREYWMDIGHKRDFETADGEFGEIFWG